MDELKQTVMAILHNTFQDVRAELDEDPPGKLSGIVITSAFSDIDNADRQRILRDALREGLGADVQRLSILFTQSPEEYDALREVDALVR